MIVDDLLLLRRRTNDPRGAGPQVELDMIGMRQGLRGIGDAVPFAALEFLFPGELVVHSHSDVRVASRLVLSLNRGQHLGGEPLGAELTLRSANVQRTDDSLRHRQGDGTVSLTHVYGAIGLFQHDSSQPLFGQRGSAGLRALRSTARIPDSPFLKRFFFGGLP